jgi:3-oxoacyl-[acyl-carrier protein] reductase
MAKRVLVTGSSRGIGRAIALKLAETGWSVAIHGARMSAELERTRDLLSANCSGVYSSDMADPSAAVAMVDLAMSEGPIHALVNNAGVYRPIQFLESSEAEFEANLSHTFAVNFETPLKLTRRVARHFQSNGGGKILNVASRVGFRGEAGAAMYSASKAALINVTRALAVELAPKNIGIFGIAPGWVETAMAREGMQQRIAEILPTIPLGRMATPEDCANASAFLLSDGSSYLSGVVIDINGASYFH